MRKSFLGCVLLHPTKSQNKGTTLLYRRFPPLTAGFSEFRARSPETREREKSMSVKPQHKGTEEDLEELKGCLDLGFGYIDFSLSLSFLDC